MNLEVETGFEPVYTALQAVASPLGHSTNNRPEVAPGCSPSPDPRPAPSGRRDSNPRPSPWQGDALPAALRPHFAPPCFLRRVEYISRSATECKLDPPAQRTRRVATASLVRVRLERR